MRFVRSITLVFVFGAVACRAEMTTPTARGQRDTSADGSAVLPGGAGSDANDGVIHPSPEKDCLRAWDVGDDADATSAPADVPFSAAMGAFVVDVDA
jgi:hypothetical protein